MSNSWCDFDSGKQSKCCWFIEHTMKAREAVNSWCCMFRSLQLPLPSFSVATSAQHETIELHHCPPLSISCHLPSWCTVCFQLFIISLLSYSISIAVSASFHCRVTLYLVECVQHMYCQPALSNAKARVSVVTDRLNWPYMIQLF